MAQFSELAGAVPVQPEPVVPAVVSWHQTERERVPTEPHDGPQPPQPPVCHE